MLLLGTRPLTITDPAAVAPSRNTLSKCRRAVCSGKSILAAVHNGRHPHSAAVGRW